MNNPIISDLLITSYISLNEIKERYGVNSKKSEIYPNLIQFNYDQINSDPKIELTRECRGLILDSTNNWFPVARPMKRFANYGESWATKIDWDTAQVQDKLDGSCIILYHYCDKWNIATRGSPDASGNVQSSNKTYKELFQQTFNSDDFILEPQNTYCFELTGPDNKHICRYDKNKVTLLSVINRITGKELDPTEFVCHYNKKYCDKFLPRQFKLQSFEDITKTFKHLNPLDNEGYVIVDKNFNRIKVKHPGYVALHHMRSSFSEKAFVEVYLNGEVQEVITCFPEYKEKFEQIDLKIKSFENSLLTLWNKTKDISSQKEFAIAINDNIGSGILFQLRKGAISSIIEGINNMRIDSLVDIIFNKKEK